MPAKVAIIPSRDVTQPFITARKADGPYTVCYLGESTAFRTYLQTLLPPDWSMPPLGDVLTAAAWRVRQIMIDLDQQAWPSDANRMWWDASALGERSPLSSRTMSDLARTLVFVDMIDEPGNFLVIADDIGFCRVLLSIGKDRGAIAGWHIPGKAPPIFLHAKVAINKIRAFFRDITARLTEAKLIFRRQKKLRLLRRRHPLPIDALLNADLIMMLWGTHETFPLKGPLRQDRYFGRLPEIIRESGCKAAYLVYPLAHVHDYDDIAANALAAEEAAILLEELIPGWAILPCLLGSLALRWRIKGLYVENIDATALLRLEAERDGCLDSVLLWFVARSLAKLNVRPKAFLHLYEHQPWEKMLALGIRTHSPKTKIVAIQHSPFSRNYVSFYPSRRAIAVNAIPDILLVSGQGYRDWFIEEGFPANRLAVIGALRYEGVIPTSSPSERSILCCTGIECDEAMELACKTALATCGLGIPVVINFHPVTNDTFRKSIKDAVATATKGNFDHVIFSDLPMRTLLESAAIVLYTTSASCFEAIMGGRTAIFVGGDLSPDYDKLPDAIAIRCRSVDDLRKLLDCMNQADLNKQSTVTLRDWLAPSITSKELVSIIK